MPKNSSNQPIRLLHLSDIHFKTGKSWDADPVLRALGRFVAEEVANGLIPDLVAITGDLAFSGTAEEYGLAQGWLERQLWPALPDGFPRDRLLLVPGNHDVDRAQADFVARAVQTQLLTQRSQEQIAKVLADAGQRDALLKRHAAYLTFLSGWLGEPQALPWWQRVIEIRGIRLHVAALDSAFMACGDQDYGNLLLGRYQINQTVVTPQAEGADWRLALVHHPWAYLAEFDGSEARKALHQHRDVLLRGHLHETHTERVLPPDPSRACLELAAGCVYEDSRYPNAFQWIELWSEPKRVRVYFRAWLHNAWTVDRNQPECPDGVAEFGFDDPSSGRQPRATGNRSGMAPTPAPSEPAVGKPRVYISYSLHTPGNERRVLKLSEKLRNRGVDARIDQYYEHALHGFTPPAPQPDRVAWAAWQEEQVRDADRVLLVCDKQYAESPEGSGVALDLALMRVELATAQPDTQKFIPVGFGPYKQNAGYVPRFLNAPHYYDLSADGDGFDDLVRRFSVEFPA